MSKLCSECWFHDCKNCTGRNCDHAVSGEHYPEDDNVEVAESD